MEARQFSRDTNSHNGYTVQLKQVTCNNTSELLDLVKFCFLPVYSQLCDASSSRVHGDTFADTAWPEELRDNYIAAVFIYYNTGTVDLSMRLNPCKMFSGKDVRHSFLNFYRGT